MLDNVRIVLVNTTHPGNIGATARAMKNMGLSRLSLVEPRCFPAEEATARSSGATDILEHAQVVASLEEAVVDCSLVIGASARQRNIPWPLLSPRQLGMQVRTECRHASADVAVVFGREDRGLTNEELHRCNYHVHIPCNPDYSSLNVAAAVQVLCYELRVAWLESQTQDEPPFGVDWDSEWADAQDMERFFAHLEQALVDIDFHDPNNPRQLMSRLRRLYLRARLDKMEVNILRGILTATQKRCKDAG